MVKTAASALHLTLNKDTPKKRRIFTVSEDT